MSDPSSVAPPAPTPPAAEVSSQTYIIAGIKVTVHGEAQAVASGARQAAVVWLLHPRTATQEWMAGVATALVQAWAKQNSSSTLGLVTASFDQRNHGTRMAHALANEAWRQGNPTHAVDMWGGFAGTARDAVQLAELLPAYAFGAAASSASPPQHAPIRIVRNLALGTSLGGHCAWHLLLHAPEFATAVAIIGCPDYAAVMADRARLSKLPSYLAATDAGDTSGAAFFGGPDFPPALVDSVGRFDPRALLTGHLPAPGETRIDTSPEQERRAAAAVRERLAGKRLLCLFGGADKLVPPAFSRPFLDWLKGGLAEGGWAAGVDFEVQEITYPGVGHEMTPAMVLEATRFVVDDLERVATTRSRI